MTFYAPFIQELASISLNSLVSFNEENFTVSIYFEIVESDWSYPIKKFKSFSRKSECAFFLFVLVYYCCSVIIISSRLLFDSSRR